jgi:hypothetical protein
MTIHTAEQVRRVRDDACAETNVSHPWPGPAYCVLVTVTSNPKRTHCLGPYTSPDAAAAVVAKAGGTGNYYDNGVYTLRVLPLVGGVS